MYSETLSGKSPKGTVQVVGSHGRLQLRFRFAGKRHCLSLSFPETATNRKLAEMRAREIELDMISGNFGPTLAKYKPHVALAVPSPDLTPKVSLAELWEGFVEYKRPQCSENTMYYVYQHTTYMEKLPTHDFRTYAMNDPVRKRTGSFIAHRLEFAKSPQSTEEMIANGLLISHLEALNITNLFDDSMKAQGLPMTVMDLFEPLTSQELQCL